MQRKVILGRISGVFGVRGWIKVFSYTEPRENIVSYRSWCIGSDNNWQRYELAEGKRHGKGVVARITQIVDREQAAELVGCDIAVDRDALPASEEGKYYWTDLVGLIVATPDGQVLGRVAGLVETGANDVLVVKGDGDGEHERLIPFVLDQVIMDVDLSDGKIVVDWDPDF